MLGKIYHKLTGWFFTRSGENIADGAAHPDIFADKEFMELYQEIKPYTMVGIERCYALYHAVIYCIRKGQAGAVAECGVWKGGSCMLICLLLIKHGITDWQLYLYDTFEGMAAPGENDGDVEKLEWQKQQGADGLNQWCRAELEEVKENMRKTGYPLQHIHFIKGKVEDSIPAVLPASLQLLRLDTDWYSSTRHELQYLYPLLQKGGVLIIDDYGAWQGAKKAVDEYFKDDVVLLNRIDETGRMLIKY